MAHEIGTITVDQSGTGRMQHVVEGMQVRNVVGQALVIYTSGTTPAVTLPPNLDATVDPAAKAAGSPPDFSLPARVRRSASASSNAFGERFVLFAGLGDVAFEILRRPSQP